VLSLSPDLKCGCEVITSSISAAISQSPGRYWSRLCDWGRAASQASNQLYRLSGSKWPFLVDPLQGKKQAFDIPRPVAARLRL